MHLTSNEILMLFLRIQRLILFNAAQKDSSLAPVMGRFLRTLCEPVLDLEDSSPVTKIQTLDDELFGSEKPLISILLDFNDANDLADENRRSSLPLRPFLLV